MQKKPIQKNQKLDVWFNWYGLAAVQQRDKQNGYLKLCQGISLCPTSRQYNTDVAQLITACDIQKF